jgi:adenylate kinase family enzyme
MGKIENIAGIYSDLMVGNNVYLYGVAGTGKTTLAKKIANVLLGRETYQVNCNQFTSPIDIKGGQTIEGYKQGELIKAWQNGGILILDELPKLDPNTAGILNEALAQSADPLFQEFVISEQEYKMLKNRIAESHEQGVELGIEVFDLKNKSEFAEYEILNAEVEEKEIRKEGFVKIIFNTIIDGKGDKIRKNKRFGVIGTGNTNLKETSVNFGGNNRQDYSLVDRFAGSFYQIGYDTALEKALTYDVVYKICEMFREKVLEKNDIESVSLRTMLNFNRIFEQQMLVRWKSPYATNPIKVGNAYMVKKLSESVDSFIKTLPEAKATLPAIAEIQTMANEADNIPRQEFVAEFIRIHSPKNSEGQIIKEVDPKFGQGKY